jgi:hypothetical protein
MMRLSGMMMFGFRHMPGLLMCQGEGGRRSTLAILPSPCLTTFHTNAVFYRLIDDSVSNESCPYLPFLRGAVSHGHNGHLLLDQDRGASTRDRTGTTRTQHRGHTTTTTLLYTTERRGGGGVRGREKRTLIQSYGICRLGEPS